jgi:RND family efflux transporter MFP subunit
MTDRSALRLCCRLVPALLLLAAGCSTAPPPQEPPPPTVTFSLPVQRQVTDPYTFQGKIAAVNSVQLRARSGGYLQKINFKEGDMVKKDQVLFEIDPRPYQAELDRAKAEVKIAEAQVTQTEAEYRRLSRLRPPDVSQEDQEKAKRDWEVALASLEAKKATVATKQLNLDFTKVLAPIDGRVDKADVTVGNLISALLNDATILTNIVSLDPIYVYFDVDELTVIRIHRLMLEGKVPAVEKKAPEVQLALGDGKDFAWHGTVDFTGNQMDASKGSFPVRGVFANKDRSLTPGVDVRVRVPLGGPHEALLVSDSALGTNRGQKYLYVLNDKDEVVYRPVTIGGIHDGLREIEKGVKPEERVVINGLLRIRPGLTVHPVKGEMKPDATGAAGDHKPLKMGEVHESKERGAHE